VQVPFGNDRLEAIGARYFAELWRVDPVRATREGVHEYDDRLGDYSAAGFAEREALARRYLTELKALDPTTMGAEASYDDEMLESALQSTLLELTVREEWRHDPSYYSSLAARAVYVLMARNFAPLRLRERAVVARERQIPAMLEAGEANVTTVDAVTADLARRNIQGALDFFLNVVPRAMAPAGDPALAREFKLANAEVVGALHAYLTALEVGALAHPSGTYAIGAKTFAQMLQLQELVPISLAEYEAAGTAALAKTKSDFIATAKAIDPSKTPEQVAASLGADHPAADELLKTATADVKILRAFVVAHKIVTLPADDDVRVVATPEFARQTSFASMNAPGPLEKTATEAFYNVTPVEPGWAAARQEQHLAFFNRYAFPLISAHEVMPGHYVNFALDRHEKLSLIRKLSESPSFAEGWAHYVEQMMVDEGWGNGDPKVRLAQLQLALQRECRYLVGLREHTQDLSVADATTFFEQNAFMSEETSHREALRGTQDPLYGYYTLGKLELLKLRDDYVKVRGSHYSLQGFHDDLLAHGDPPIAIVRKIMLGADDDGKLL
jgi:hypothetical protein